MATIILSLSTKSDKVTSQREVMIRFFHGKHINQRAKTNVFVHPDYWDDAARQLFIAGRTGKFKGMLKKRQFRITLVGETERVVAYKGKKLTVKF